MRVVEVVPLNSAAGGLVGSAPRRAALYVRISEDRLGARLGVERQAEDCRALAERLGWEVVAVYEDNDISAYSGKPRPGYRRLMEAVEQGAVDAVVAWHPDRLHRRPIELETFLEVIERNHVAVATVQAGEMDLATPSGRLVARQLGSVARYESEHKAERVRRAMAQRRSAGKPHGRRVYGYRDTSIVEEEAEHIRWAVAQLSEGAAWNDVVRGLNARGAVTAEGGPWDRRSLKRVLTNPRLRGQLAHRGHIVNEGAWPAILTSQEWARLQGRITRGERREARHLLSGILRCGKCGAGLVHGPARSKPRPVPPIYWCIPSPSGLARGCGGTSIQQPLADTAVTQILLVALEKARVPSRDDEEIAALEASISELRSRQQEIADALAHGTLSLAVATSADAQIREQIEAAEAELTAAAAAERVSEVSGTGVRELWDRMDVAGRRGLITDAVERIVVRPVGRGWHGSAMDRLEVVWRG